MVITAGIYMALHTYFVFIIYCIYYRWNARQKGDNGPHYAVPRTLVGPRGVRLVEMRPNSEPDTPYPHRLFVVPRLAICPLAV